MNSQITIEGVTYPLELTPGPVSQKVQAGPHTVEVLVNALMVVLVLDMSSCVYYSTDDLGSWLACSKTGQLYAAPAGMDRTSQLQRDQHVCFRVAFWLELAERYKNHPYWFRIDGHSYACPEEAICRDREPRRPSSERGFSGRTFRIKRNDSEEVLLIDNLWHQGELPAWLAKDYPDNAEFIIPS